MNLPLHISCLKRFTLFFFLLNLFFIPNLKSQTNFTPIDTIIGQNYYIHEETIIEWIDYDNDGDLDLFIISALAIQIYENLGNNNFQLNNNSSLFYNTLNVGFFYKDIGDINNDGNIDILVRGQGGGNNYIFKNTLPDSIGFDTASFAGHLLISGFDNIYNYQGLDIITALPNGIWSIYALSQLNNSLNKTIKDSLVLSSNFNFRLEQKDNYDRFRTHNYDFNKDGYFDYINFGGIALNNGLDSSSRFSVVLRPRPHMYGNYVYGGLRGDMHFYDLDNDGYLDVYENFPAIGDNRFNPYSNKIYRNNHNNQLIEQTNTGLDTLWHNEQCLFDYDNDGRIDVMLSKSNDSTFIFKNNGNFNFTQDSTILNLPYKLNDAASADYDNDGDIDLAVLYNDTVSNQYKVIIFRNDSTPANNPPTKPEVLWTTMDSTKIIFHWKQATDVETPQAALGYNVMVGTSPNGIDIVSPLADTATGFRKIVRLGNAQLNDFFILDKSKFNIGDTLYWRVQTLDNSHGYSPFSQSQMTVVCNRIEAPVFDTICSGDSVIWRNNYYSTNGVHSETYASNSCDSSFSLRLKVNPTYFYLEDIDICSNESYTWRGQTYYTSGIHTEHFTTESGCDSIYKLDLSVHHSITTFKNEQLCQGDSTAFANGYLKTPGVYVDSTSTIFGCDSIAHLTLSVSPNDTNIIVQGTKLIGQDFSASYRWLDCDAQLFIPGANKRIFSPFLDGNYAAEISLNGCSYLTKCYSITGTGIRNLESSDIKIFPNPTESFVIIESQKQQISKIVLKSIDGKVLKIIEDINSSNQKVDLSNYEKGIYIFSIWIEGEVFYYRVVRE